MPPESTEHIPCIVVENAKLRNLYYKILKNLNIASEDQAFKNYEYYDVICYEEGKIRMASEVYKDFTEYSTLKKFIQEVKKEQAKELCRSQ